MMVCTKYLLIIQLAFTLPNFAFSQEQDEEGDVNYWSEEDNAYSYVEEAPFLQSCSTLVVNSEREICTIQEITKHVLANLNAANFEQSYDFETTMLIRFVVGKTGEIEDFEMLRSINGRVDKDVENAIKNLPVFTPGKKDGKPVRVIFNVPMIIELSQ